MCGPGAVSNLSPAFHRPPPPTDFPPVRPSTDFPPTSPCISPSTNLSPTSRRPPTALYQVGRCLLAARAAVRLAPGAARARPARAAVDDAAEPQASARLPALLHARRGVGPARRVGARLVSQGSWPPLEVARRFLSTSQTFHRLRACPCSPREARRIARWRWRRVAVADLSRLDDGSSTRFMTSGVVGICALPPAETQHSGSARCAVCLGVLPSGGEKVRHQRCRVPTDVGVVCHAPCGTSDKKTKMPLQTVRSGQNPTAPPSAK